MFPEPIDTSEAVERGLGPILQVSHEAGVPGDRFIRLLGHVPGYAEAIHEAMHESHMRGRVDHRLKEIIRIQLARTADDPYFAKLRSTKAIEQGLTEERIDAGSGDFEQNPQFTDAERWALRYAHLLYQSPEQVGHAFYEEGRRYYSEAEIMELGGMIAIHYGMQRFIATLSSPTSVADDPND